MFRGDAVREALPKPSAHAPLTRPSRLLPMAVVFLLVATVGAGMFGALQPATGIPTEVIQLTQFGPALAVAVLALGWPARTRALLRGAVRGPRGQGTGLALLATAPLILALCVAVGGVVTGDVDFTQPNALDHPFLLIVAAQLVGACGEEIGWRCLLQPLLRTRFGPLLSSALVGVVWGAWHVPVFSEGLGYAAGFVVGATSLSVVLGLALERVRSQRLLLAGSFHTLINLGMLLFMNEETGAVVPMALFGGSCLVAAALWIWRAPADTARTAHPE